MQFLCFILMLLNSSAMILFWYALNDLDKEGKAAGGVWIFIFLFGFNTFYMMQSM